MGVLARASGQSVESEQVRAWQYEIGCLKAALSHRPDGWLALEFSIPRMGKRVDAVLILNGVVFVIEFKVGAFKYTAHAVDQVWDYALDLMNFHEPSHDRYLVPVLIATEAAAHDHAITFAPFRDKVLNPVRTSGAFLWQAVQSISEPLADTPISGPHWVEGRYYPTPTIIEAATALYNNHSVEEISRSDAGAINLSRTSTCIEDVIQQSKARGVKSICFVTGVPGAGKTLAGLNIATKHRDANEALHSVFLSGNGPLVNILQEALARDYVSRQKITNKKAHKGDARSTVKKFVQNVHHFRDDCLRNGEPPAEHVALFDEAQRAWNLSKTADFMKRKKGIAEFAMSEPEFLISCLDRHRDWAVVVCLVGGGQEINTGEAGISEWIDALTRSYSGWQVYVSPKMTDREYGAGDGMKRFERHPHVHYRDELHLAVSMRSFRAENVSHLVKQLLDLEIDEARRTLGALKEKYSIVITRDLSRAKSWLRARARGTERYGLVVSSQAERLKPYAVDVKSPMNPVHWFLHDKTDVRSSYYMEQVATEFHVQGLELDWAGVVWDADLRYRDHAWEHWAFKGSRWQHIRQSDRRMYQLNAYRVLMTRARQGMVLVVPSGDDRDPTRKPSFYDHTYDYLSTIGFESI